MEWMEWVHLPGEKIRELRALSLYYWEPKWSLHDSWVAHEELWEKNRAAYPDFGYAPGPYFPQYEDVRY